MKRLRQLLNLIDRSGAIDSNTRIRIPDFSILDRARPREFGAGGRLTDGQLAERECEYCGQAYGFSVPIYRDPLFDGKMTGHLSCAIEYDDVRVWTPEDFAAKWSPDTQVTLTNASADANTDVGAVTGAERLLAAILDGDAIISAAAVSEPCQHILAFVEFYVSSPIAIVRDSPVACIVCDVQLSARAFSALISRVTIQSAERGQ